jgi:hypothetical protein
LFFRINQKTKDTYANWWDETWMYRQSINISSHNSDESNVFITTTIGLGSTAKAQADAGDFRFLNSSGQLLPYYIVSGAGTTSITFHINLDSFPSGAQTLYAYYGNPSASNGFSASDFSTEASNYTLGSLGTEEVGGGPIAHWKFDEGVGTTAFDSSSNSKNGLITSATWQKEESCVSGNCLFFSGTSDSSVRTDPVNPSLQMTVSAWVKRTDNTADGMWHPIVSSGGNLNNGTGWFFSFSPSWGELRFYIGDNTNHYINANISNFPVNEWQFLTATVTNSNFSLYLNGRELNTLNHSVSAIVYDSSPLKIGTLCYCGCGDHTFQGYLDDVKIFPYARTESQIKADYTAGLAGMSTSSDSSVNIGGASSKSLSDGLVGYWKFDEGVGTTTIDYSGNNFTASLGGTLPSWSSGKYGIGITFTDGSYLNISNSTTFDFPSSNFALSTWIKMTSSSSLRTLFWKGNPYCDSCQGGYVLNVSSGTPRMTLDFSSATGNMYTATSSTAVNDDKWHHLLGQRNGNKIEIYIDGNLSVATTFPSNSTFTDISSSMLSVSSIAYSFNGSLDETRIYNRALSPTEVKQLYEFAPGPVAYYNFEEGQGTVITDRSTNNYSSTSTTGTPVWVNGKYGTAASFNGSAYSQFPSLGTGSYAGTTSMWINFPANYSSSTAISNIGPFFIGSTSANRLNFDINRGGTWVDGNWGTVTNFYVNDIPANTWTYVTVTWDSGTAKVFINGTLKLTKSYTTGPLTNNGGNWLGHWNSGNNYTGKVDEVKIYNYARTQKQIIEDMNAGAPATSARGGPLIHYKLDEEKGTVSNNSGFGGSSYNGTINGSNWSFSQGKVGKGLKVSTNQESSLINYMVWKDGQTGSVTGFTQNGDASENYRIIDSDPWGRKVVVWEARPDAVSGADGGWNGSTFSIDNSKLYRFSVWINRTVTGNGSAYFGTHGYGSINAIYVRGAGTTTTNPYFYSGTPSQDTWTLFVGHIWPAGSGTGSQHTDSGRYTISGGKIGAISNDFVWLPENTSSHLRTYLYYSTDTSTRQQWIYPRVDIVDGSEPSIQELIDGYGAYGDDVLLQTSDSPETVTLWYDKNSTGSWQHLAKSGSNYYVNGKIATPEEYPVYTSENEIYFGRTTASDFVSGLIDEVKIYNYALSADEVKQDYNQGSTFVFGGSNQTIGATTTSLDYCIPGDTSPCSPPVGEWKFEEGVGTTAYDTSGNNKHCSLTTGSAAPNTLVGKIGSALGFNGVNSYANCGNQSIYDITDEITFEFWLKPEDQITNWPRPIAMGGYATKGWSIYTGTTGVDTLNFQFGTDSGWSGSFAPTINYLKNQWNHIVVTVKLGVSGKSYLNGKLIGSQTPATYYSGTTSNLNFGYNQGYYKGGLDQVRIYNYARTPAQIAWSFNKGAPVGHWKMDECQGTQIADWSGNANHGTLSIGTSGTQTSPGTCTTSGAWANGKLGKLNASLNFDGSDDKVSIPDPTSGILDFNASTSLTMSAWIKTTDTSDNYHVIFEKGGFGGQAYRYGLFTYNNTLRIIVNDFSSSVQNFSSSGITVNDGNWHHVVGVVDRVNTKLLIYSDGKFVNETTLTRPGTFENSNPLNFSSNNSFPFPGQIDDVRIYNYALTPTQIKTLYNNGAVTFR